MTASRFIKCVTVWEGTVGKTCLLISYTSNTFPMWVSKISQEEGNDTRIMENPICERIRDALYPNRNRCAVETDVLSHDDSSRLFASDDDDETSSIYESVVGWDDDSTDSDEADDTKGTDMTKATAENDTKKKTDYDQTELSYYTKNKVPLSPLVGHAIGTLEEAISAIRDSFSARLLVTDASTSY